MKRLLSAVAVVCVWTAVASADPPGQGPTNTAVLMPPQFVDEAVKAPNHTREHYGEWSISGGVMLLHPVFDSNPAFLVNSPGLTRQVDFTQHLNVAPEIWLSYVSERGWGVRGHWFQFEHSTSESYLALPGETIRGMSPFVLGRAPVNGAVAASSNLAVNVFDLQATCNFSDARWSHLLGIGVRYAHMSQDYDGVITNPATVIELASSHNLNGVGPSFAVETKRRIGEKGFSIYGQLDGAILVGRAREGDVAINNAVPRQFTHSLTRVVPTADLEVGLEYERNAGRAKAFVQLGYAGQVWWSGGNTSNLNAPGFTSASSSNFGFVGLALRAGVRY